MACDLEVSAFYLDRDPRFNKEKPFELRFPPPEGFASRNTSWTEYNNIKVTDVRGKEDQVSIDKHGFQLCNLATSLTAAEFENLRKVETVFLKEVAHCLQQTLGADRVLVFDYNRRRSTPGYPISSGESVEIQTPATIVHVDTSEAWTTHMNTFYKENLAGDSLGSRYQYVNVWKPIMGPVKKWPLMLCDWNTYSPKSDIIARDLVDGDGHLETSLAYHNPNHAYYYVSEQSKDEAWIMVQSDSISGKGVLHTAFNSPLTRAEDPERESIEVRCMVYFK